MTIAISIKEFQNRITYVLKQYSFKAGNMEAEISDEPSVEFQSSDTAVHPVMTFAYPNILKAGMQSPNSLYVLSVGYTSGSDIRYPKVCSFAKQI